MATSLQVVSTEPYGYSSSLQYYSSLSSDAYTRKSAYPQSCSCKMNRVQKSQCVYYECDCVCDVTAGLCDYGCCCDPDCTASQIERFQKLDVCLPQGNEGTFENMCYSSNQLHKINARTPMGGQSTAQRAVGEALCVEKRNFVTETEFYPQAGVKSSSVFFTEAGTKTYSYWDQAAFSTAKVMPADIYYDQNDTLAATESSGSKYLSVGTFSVPRSDGAGVCQDHQAVLFEVDYAPSQCSRLYSTEDLTHFQNDCVSGQSVGRFVSNLNLKKDASSDSVLTVPVTISSVTYVDFDSDAVSDITAIWSSASCATALIDGATYRGSTPSCGASETSLPEVIAADDFVCKGMVRAVHYAIFHDADDKASITEIKAQVVVSDVPLTAAASASTPTTLRVTQTFSVEFISSSNVESTTLGNIVERKRSGNPGYLTGMPVLFGVMNGDVVSEATEGLAVPTAVTSYDASSPSSFGAGLCPTEAQLTDVQSLHVRFGYDLVSGCVLSLSRLELKDFCCSMSSSCTGTSDYVQTSTSIPVFLSKISRIGKIGVLGNSDPLDENQWIDLTYSASTTSTQWDDVNGVCSNVPAAIGLQFLVSPIGEKSNPQNKITSALASTKTSTWSMRMPSSDSTSKQTFQLSVTASFVFSEQLKLSTYNPPAPPVLFKVPYDLFYPFYKNSAVSSAHMASSVMVVISILVVSLMMSLQ